MVAYVCEMKCLWSVRKFHVFYKCVWSVRRYVRRYVSHFTHTPHTLHTLFTHKCEKVCEKVCLEGMSHVCVYKCVWSVRRYVQKVCFLLCGRGVFRVSESLLYRSVCVQHDVCVGCQKYQHIRVHAIICIFWHPTYLCFCPVTAPSRCSPCSYSDCNVAASCRPT